MSESSWYFCSEMSLEEEIEALSLLLFFAETKAEPDIQLWWRRGHMPGMTIIQHGR
jgi:hypothetical protein